MFEFKILIFGKIIIIQVFQSGKHLYNITSDSVELAINALVENFWRR